MFLCYLSFDTKFSVTAHAIARNILIFFILSLDDLICFMVYSEAQNKAYFYGSDYFRLQLINLNIWIRVLNVVIVDHKYNYKKCH